MQVMAMPNVLVTAHQAFAITEALQNIAVTTFYNLSYWEKEVGPGNELPYHPLIKQPVIYNEEEA